jgi:GNAT superfamily N-acetyltransferase
VSHPRRLLSDPTRTRDWPASSRIPRLDRLLLLAMRTRPYLPESDTLLAMRGTSGVPSRLGEDLPMEIRTAELRDVDVVCRLRLEFLAEYRGIDPNFLPNGFEDATRQFVTRSHSDGTLLSWLAEEAGIAIGLVSVVLQNVPPRPEELRTVEGLVINMFVRQSGRSRGIGRLLLGACSDAASAYGIRRLNLYATTDGRPLYSAAGFNARSDWMTLDIPPKE